MAGTQPVLDHIETQRIKWFGRLDTKTRGRPRKWWIDGVTGTLVNLLPFRNLGNFVHVNLPGV